MAKFTLNIEYDFDFMVFAVSSHEPDYKLCHKLNQGLGLDLQKEEALELKNKNQADNLLFSFFVYVNEEEQLEYNLLSNKSYNAVQSNKPAATAQADLFGESDPGLTGQKGFLVSELNTTDYLLIVRTPYDPEFAYELESAMKQIDAVINVRYVDVNELPSKNNLIF
ncbi:MAG TPA: IPExxxVDY family protein [Bacteroidia bacterium]